MPYVLGVDGGGSHTVCLVVDHEGNILGSGESGPSNYHSTGLPAAVEAIWKSIEMAVAAAPSVTFPVEAICLGLAGVDTPQDEELLRREVEKLNVARATCVVNDTEIALFGGTGGGPGVVVVGGTGSAAFGCDGCGHKARSGGWGWILGDEGSAFDIAQKALRAVVRTLEGRDQAKLLVEALIARWHLPDMDFLTAELRGRSWSRRDVAGLADWVTDCAKRGDPVALSIISRAGQDLGSLAVTVIRRLGMQGNFPVVLTGGVFRAGELVCEPLRDTVLEVAPQARFIEPEYPPVLGAVFMSLQHLDLPISPEFLKKVKSSIAKPGGCGGNPGSNSLMPS